MPRFLMTSGFAARQTDEKFKRFSYPEDPTAGGSIAREMSGKLENALTDWAFGYTITVLDKREIAAVRQIDKN